MATSYGAQTSVVPRLSSSGLDSRPFQKEPPTTRRVPPVLMRMDEAAVRSLPYFSVLAPPVHFSPKLRAHRRSGRGLRSSLALLRDLGRENRRLWNPADGRWQRESTWHVTRRRHFCSRFIGQCKSHGHAQAHRGWRKET